MSPEGVSAFLKRRPFLPFKIHVTGNIEYTIREPGAAQGGQKVLFIGEKLDSASEFFDLPVFVAMRHITHLEPIEATGEPRA